MHSTVTMEHEIEIVSKKPVWVPATKVQLKKSKKVVDDSQKEEDEEATAKKKAKTEAKTKADAKTKAKTEAKTIAKTKSKTNPKAKAKATAKKAPKTDEEKQKTRLVKNMHSKFYHRVLAAERKKGSFEAAIL